MKGTIQPSVKPVQVTALFDQSQFLFMNGTEYSTADIVANLNPTKCCSNSNPFICLAEQFVQDPGSIVNVLGSAVPQQVRRSLRCMCSNPRAALTLRTSSSCSWSPMNGLQGL